MTDITELVQSLKAAAEKATPGEWHKGRQDPVTGIIKVYARTGSTKLNCVVKTDAHEVGFGISEREHKANAELIALANPVNILALVEALEKAQRMESYWKTQCRGITDHCEELQAQIDYLQKIAHEQNELATKASNENASLSVMHGKALKHIDSLEKDLVPVYQFIMNNHHKDGYIEWCDCNKQYYETVNEEERRILYSNVGVELQTVPPVTYFENDDAYQCRKWAWQGTFRCGWEACRAAMLQAGYAVRDLSTPVDPQVAEYEQNVLQAGNSPVIPDGLIAAVNRLLDSDGSRGCYSAIQCGDAHDEIERLLAAAPQEVKP